MLWLLIFYNWYQEPWLQSRDSVYSDFYVVCMVLYLVRTLLEENYWFRTHSWFSCDFLVLLGLMVLDVRKFSIGIGCVSCFIGWLGVFLVFFKIYSWLRLSEPHIIKVSLLVTDFWKYYQSILVFFEVLCPWSCFCTDFWMHVHIKIKTSSSFCVYLKIAFNSIHQSATNSFLEFISNIYWV